VLLVEMPELLVYLVTVAHHGKAEQVEQEVREQLVLLVVQVMQEVWLDII